MTAVAPAVVARWLPRWRELVDLAFAAAAEPHADPARLKALADEAAGTYGKRNSGWPIPLSSVADQWVGWALLKIAQAFCRQTSGVMRATLADLLRDATMAFQGRLARAVPAFSDPAPVLPLRPRRDIDDVED